MSVGDVIALIFDTEMDTLLFSADGTFGIGQVDNFSTRAVFPETTWRTESVSDALRKRNRRFHLNPTSKTAFMFKWLDFAVVTTAGSSVVVVSYLMIVLPLSLLSAYLLLFTPKRATASAKAGLEINSSGAVASQVDCSNRECGGFSKSKS